MNRRLREAGQAVSDVFERRAISAKSILTTQRAFAVLSIDADSAGSRQHAEPRTIQQFFLRSWHVSRQRRAGLHAEVGRNVAKTERESGTVVAVNTRSGVDMMMPIPKDAPCRIDVPQTRSPLLAAAHARTKRFLVDEVVARHAARMREHKGECQDDVAAPYWPRWPMATSSRTSHASSSTLRRVASS